MEINSYLETIGMDKSVTSEQILNSLENLMEAKETALRELNEYNVTLTNQYNEKVEQKFVLELGKQFFAKENMIDTLNDVAPATPATSTIEKGASEIRFGYITGVLNTDDRVRFERMIFRVTRGNCLVRFSDIMTPLADATTGQDVRKSVFLVFYRSTLIENKVKRIIDAFDGHAYANADLNNPVSVKNAYEVVMSELEEAERVVNLNIDKCEELLRDIAKYIMAWRWTVKKEKAVYDVFNRFKPVASGNMYGEGWVLTEKLDEIRQTVDDVHRGKESSGYVSVMAKPWPKPPTHFHTNEFTCITQSVVDTYGMPSYKECNPAVFTLVTFPFQFGIMFGDFGHAIFITLVAIYFIINSDKMKKNGMNDIISMIFSGRNMLILMGIFGMYMGFLYNDQFSIGVDWFGTTWSFPEGEQGVWSHRVYPFGLDPVWHDKANSLLFYNSYKMKFACIFGISQMILGVFLKWMNCFYHHEHIDFWCEALPQMIFMLSFFGWMIVLMVMKWLIVRVTVMFDL